jgi:hypothetical protein
VLSVRQETGRPAILLAAARWQLEAGTFLGLAIAIQINKFRELDNAAALVLVMHFS